MKNTVVLFILLAVTACTSTVSHKHTNGKKVSSADAQISEPRSKHHHRQEKIISQVGEEPEWYTTGDPKDDVVYETGSNRALRSIKGIFGGGGSVASSKKYNVVHLFYATDRNRKKTKKYHIQYGGKRGRDISYGEVIVSIPYDHVIGEIETPSLFKLEFTTDSKKHFKIIKIKEEEKNIYYFSMNKALTNTSKKDALLFFHGYNVSFSAAAKRTAQITYDLKFNGISSFYSWPSVGSLSGYPTDEANIKWSEKNIERYIDEISQKTNIDKIYIIAHSMGNRGLTRALSNLLEKSPSIRKKIKEIILAAPDIDADIFKRDILPRLANQDIPITLYVSKNDQALMASKTVHGYPRAGDAVGNIITAEGMETIDVSGIDNSLLGHSYFSEEQSVLSDIYGITSKQLRANQRESLIKSENGKYWIFKKK